MPVISFISKLKKKINRKVAALKRAKWTGSLSKGTVGRMESLHYCFVVFILFTSHNLNLRMLTILILRPEYVQGSLT